MKSNNPELRFKEFKDEWKKVKLRNLTERVRGNDGRMDLPTLTISAANGWLDQKDRFSGNIAGKEQKNYTLLKKGELSYNHGNSKLAKYGMVFVLKNFKEALVPRIYHSFKTTNEASPYFIEAMFATKKPDKELGKLISSGARMDGLLNINYEDFVGINITVPKIDEQNKIGDFILSLESTINLSQQELDALKQTKQGFLQKMFPKQGESEPQLRFSGFKEKWNQKKLIEIVDFFNNNRIPIEAENRIKGNYAYYGASGIIDYVENYIFDGEYVLLAEDGANIITRSSPIAYITQGKFWVNNHAHVMRMKTGSNFFLLQQLERQNYKKFNSGTAQPKLNAKIVHNINISIPTENEQIKIGEFFKQLDEVIDLKEQELEVLKKTKQGFLQKMFV